MLLLLLHPELIDYPAFWVYAALFLILVGVALYVALRRLSRGKKS